MHLNDKVDFLKVGLVSGLFTTVKHSFLMAFNIHSNTAMLLAPLFIFTHQVGLSGAMILLGYQKSP